ncbi:unnamed protein product [Rotaria magnacalcarata]|uniref:Uncharacterized protein n=1 Tax=Rotaria magnacalcarata TaxID=392030 RepID=A0A815XSE8_9BILA|nr:unnamed protein product [Rotaria magnacalcarata]
MSSKLILLNLLIVEGDQCRCLCCMNKPCQVKPLQNQFYVDKCWNKGEFECTNICLAQYPNECGLSSSILHKRRLEKKILTLTSDFESDSFVSEMSINGLNQEKNSVENIRRSLDIQGEKLNEITSNNRQLIHVESQLAGLRSELEKSEMLRQTLEYELTLLRTQRGKQNAFTNQLQNQFNQANEQMKQLQSELNTINHQKVNQLKEKDKKIKELENQAEIFHDRERRIEALNEQIQKMEKSESLSGQNLAQSILSKERETELKREHEVFRIKLEYSEQALEQERAISNEAKLNVQLLNNRLSDMEIKCEELKENNKNQERKIDELERQCTNEKILRTTLSKIQSELETNCAQTQKLTVDYEKQLKTIRDELSNYRRKFRNNEEKYNQIVNKIFEYLRLTKIIQETTNQSDMNLPTVKQLEELKIYIEHLKNSKLEQTNEILLNLIDFKLKNLIGKNSNNIENNLNELEKQCKNIHLKISLLEEKLIERDNGTLQLTQKLEGQVLNLKHDLDQRHQTFLTQKNQLLQTNLNQIQN